MDKTHTCIGISVDDMKTAADELTSSIKKLRYSAASLDSNKDKLAVCDVKSELVSRLSRQLDILRTDVENAEIMAAVLYRIADEAELSENSILEHEDHLKYEANKVDMCDLSQLAELIDEAAEK